MRFKILTAALLILFLFGCQKYGLAVEFPKDYAIESKDYVSKEKPEVPIPITKALVMKDGMLDFSLITPKDLLFKFDFFNLNLAPGIFEDKAFHRFVIFEPKDADNDFSVVLELNPKGQILRQTIIQKKGGVIVDGKEFIFQR